MSGPELFLPPKWYTCIFCIINHRPPWVACLVAHKKKWATRCRGRKGSPRAQAGRLQWHHHPCASTTTRVTTRVPALTRQWEARTLLFLGPEKHFCCGPKNKRDGAQGSACADCRPCDGTQKDLHPTCWRSWSSCKGRRLRKARSCSGSRRCSPTPSLGGRVHAAQGWGISPC